MFPPFLFLLGFVVVTGQVTYALRNCRNVPGSPGYPTDAQWKSLGESVSGRLVRAIPSGEYCRQVNCTDDQWASAVWRNSIPGAMNSVNWEQDYESNPPSLCGRTTPDTCGQGDVPLYAILAESAEDIQAGVNFARKHNLRLSVKSSGHDLLGRSTAKQSLLIHTHKLQSIAFTDSFYVGHTNQGPAVTVGSGVGLSALYNASKEVDKIFVGGTAATVVAAGGYLQGGGHSKLSPLLGLAVDNVLELNIVTADGTIRRTNEVDNPDLFWALRGGGAGSWGVIVNATLRTYPTFKATQSDILLAANNSTTVGAINRAYAKHIFDFDAMNVGQNFQITAAGPNATFIIGLTSHFPHATAERAVAALEPLLTDILDAGGVLISNTTNTAIINELLALPDDQSGTYGFVGSRLIPTSVYRQSPDTVGNVFKHLFDTGTFFATTVLTGGGKVAENARIDSAVNPGWRKAKTHVIVASFISEQSTIEDVHAGENAFQNRQLPILEHIQGPVPAAYSNEADAFEEKWQSVFYGKNYPRLSAIKRQYDPTDLFIVKTGVGSEQWDSYGLCRI